jgi:hypothetical protein
MAPRGMQDDLHAGAIVIEAGDREAALVGTTTERSQGTATGTRTFSLVVPPTGLLNRLPAVSRCRGKPNIDTGGEFPLAVAGRESGQAGGPCEAISSCPQGASRIRHQCQHSCHQGQTEEPPIRILGQIAHC